jgi:penicillin-binding protein 2
MPPKQFQLKDLHREIRINNARTLTAIILVLGLLGLILSRYYSLQITDYEIYSTQSERNRVQLQPLPPRRGLIYDRNGVVLADNRPSFILSVVREQVEDLDATLAELAELLPITESDLENFRKKLAQRRPYEAVPLRFRLTEEERAILAVNRYQLPGVVVDAQLQRHYPHGELFSHAIGYVGRINEQEAKELDQSDYRGTFHIGKVGVEKYYEDTLHGKVGYQNVETNAHGRVLRVLESVAPTSGADLVLNLDIRLQRAPRCGRGHRSPHRRCVGAGFHARVRYQPVCEWHQFGRLQRTARFPRRAPLQPRHPGPVPAGLDDQALHGDGGAEFRPGDSGKHRTRPGVVQPARELA